MSDSTDEDTGAPPFKKARYKWQVKNLPSSNKKDKSSKDSDPSEHSQAIANGDCELETTADTEETSVSDEEEDTNSQILDKFKKYFNHQTEKIVQSTISNTLSSNNDSAIEEGIFDNIQNTCRFNETENNNDNNNIENEEVLYSQQTFEVGASDNLDANISNAHNDPNTGSNSLDYITRWQSQQKAKAIVDNAINMTLEEMGLTPNLEQNVPVLERLQVEDEGINEVIRNRGLYPQNNENMLHDTFSPLLEQLTQVSDTVFADRLNSMRLFITIRQTSRNPGDSSQDPLEWTDELAIPAFTNRSSDNQGPDYINVTDDEHIQNQAFQLSLNSQSDNSYNYDDSNFENYYEGLDEYGNIDESYETPETNVDINCNSGAVLTNHSEGSHAHNQDSLIDDIKPSASRTESEDMDDSDIMNCALSAAINAKGLTLKENP